MDETPSPGVGESDAVPPREDRDYDVALIVAVAGNGVIGREGEMPWHYSEDLRHFRETTTGHPVVLGRRTYERIVDRLGEPLPDRTSVVLSSQDLTLPDGVLLANSVPAALETAAGALPAARNTVYVAGGGSVYEATMPVADRLVVTEIDATVDGDTYFPEIDPQEWVERSRDDRDDLSFVTYERRTSGGR